MKILNPGCNDPKWTCKVFCASEYGGCGAELLIERHDLYYKDVLAPPSPSHWGYAITTSTGVITTTASTYVTKVCYICIFCGVENDLLSPMASAFKNLPTKEKWFSSLTKKQQLQVLFQLDKYRSF